MDFLATLLVPGFGLAAARYTGAEAPARGTRCVVDRGGDLNLGTLLSAEPAGQGAKLPLARLVRVATEADARDAELCRAMARDAETAFAAMAAKYSLPTRCVKAHVFLGRSRMILWHSPQGPMPDLRSFEGEFRRKVRCSVELREADARLSAALLGGCGCCGRDLCCAMGRMPLRELPPQEAAALAASPAPQSVNGLCGRPKCCLSF